MAVTLTELEKRLTQVERSEILDRRAEVEQEVARLRKQVGKTLLLETPAERGARLLTQARRDKARLKAAVAKAFEEMGIQGEPVPPEKLREMMAACGINPEDNLFSRGIMEMREE